MSTVSAKEMEDAMDKVDKTVLLSNILEAINVENPMFFDFTKTEVIDSICKGLVIVPYLPLVYKKSYMTMYMSHVHMAHVDLDDPVDLTIQMEKLNIQNLLLRAYTNIDVDIDEFTDEHYDALMVSGFINHILKTCGEDYAKLLHLLSESFRIEKLYSDYEMLSSFDINELNAGIEKVTEMFTNMSEEKLARLDAILTVNDPKFKKFKDEFIK
jgi:hypothetical protein